MISYRFLHKNDFEQYYQTLLAAFSDYYVEVNPSSESVRRMLIIEGVKLDYSVGAFDGKKMVGFTMNAIGDWNGKLTAYDAGTGVLPDYRRRGVSRGMFEFILPVLRKQNVKQYLLEVITENKPALRLYENLGFRTVRELVIFKRNEALIQENAREDVLIKEIENPDWDLLKSFWTYYPSWQNSIDSIKRSARDETINKVILGLYSERKLAAYGIVFKNSGNVPQLAVDKKYRRKDFGKTLLSALQKQTEKPLFLSNIDKKSSEGAAFLAANGFKVLTSQYEMLLKL